MDISSCKMYAGKPGVNVEKHVFVKYNSKIIMCITCSLTFILKVAFLFFFLEGGICLSAMLHAFTDGFVTPALCLYTSGMFHTLLCI